jgi:hypothetical protein
MEQGIYGFPPGKNITVDIQEFDSTGIWNKPVNAKFCIVEGTGAGGGGGGSTGSAGVGGAAGVAYQITVMASRLKSQEDVVIGLGGAGAIGGGTASDGGNTVFTGYYWMGGRPSGASLNSRNAFIAIGANIGSFGAGALSGSAGRVGNFGAGGGGAGGTSGNNGNSGGLARAFTFGAASGLAATGGGAAGGTSGSTAGENANITKDRNGFGEGGGGGYGGSGGNGGNGRRGSGGGGGGAFANTNGGNGGDGFLRIITYSWE